MLGEVDASYIPPEKAALDAAIREGIDLINDPVNPNVTPEERLNFGVQYAIAKALWSIYFRMPLPYHNSYTTSRTSPATTPMSPYIKGPGLEDILIALEEPSKSDTEA